jgi:dTDP-4-amino-4,6-dideoxygalactose transaminase
LSGNVPHAEERARTSLSLPMFAELEESELPRVAGVFERWPGDG